MCGIFGTITNDVNNLDLTKIHLLGVMNEDRGTDSCGLYLDGVIYAGFEKNLSTYRNFALSMYKKPKHYPFILGHTRQASPGAKITVENVHPFGFGFNKKKGYSFVGAHNGTLYNKEDLAKEFGVDLKSGDREKIDSEILLECIYKSKNFKVLEKYHGAAALSFVDVRNNKMYLYSGSSGEYTTVKPVLERPLHVYVESETVLHYSSESLPLMLLGASDDEVFQIENNIVYEFTPGDFANAKEYPIDRSKMTQKKEYFNNYGNYGNYGKYGGYGGWGDIYDEEPVGATIDIYHNLLHKDDHTKMKKIEYKYFKSTPPLHLTKEKNITYSLGGLYYTNDSKSVNTLANGVYIYMESLGYFKISDKTTDLYSTLRMLDDNFFNMKDLAFEFNEKKINWSAKDSAYMDYFTVPSIVMTLLKADTPLSDDRYDGYFHYFYEGNKLKSALDFSVCQGRKPSFKDLSYMVEEVMLSKENVAYKDGSKFTGTFENLYYIFNFKEGVCSKVELKQKIESFLIFNYRYE